MLKIEQETITESNAISKKYLFMFEEICINYSFNLTINAEEDDET